MEAVQKLSYMYAVGHSFLYMSPSTETTKSGFVLVLYLNG